MECLLYLETLFLKGVCISGHWSGTDLLGKLFKQSGVSGGALMNSRRSWNVRQQTRNKLLFQFFTMLIHRMYDIKETAMAKPWLLIRIGLEKTRKN
ncbi:unnamed protein product [Trifolium pratense]|uniref:Uncharacterized protein n=1 Tax=Trifolium pratense TaxID=57577 RepID=A0ACB0ITL2_TRIPR|nr:unnamed protein product [Trifolium pratense]